MKNRRCVVCGKPSRNTLCGWHDKNHDPVPDHHVAAKRACVRCRKGFESTWSGDRVCPGCREVQRKAECSGHWHESPLEPIETPALA